MTALFAMQLALPLAMILWLALAAPYSAVGFGIQLIGSLAGLYAIALLGIWLLPPWWAPGSYLIVNGRSGIGTNLQLILVPF